MNNRICFCVPARFGSTRLKNKLLLPVNGESCIRKTIKRVMDSKYAQNENIYVFTDNIVIEKEVSDLDCKVIITEGEYKNGSERISKNLCKLDVSYDIVVNVQADEPFISPKNIDFCIGKHLETDGDDDKLFYTTLHETQNTEDYLKSTASLKVIVDMNNNVIYYSRNIIPWNKNGEINRDFVYKTFTGIYVYDTDKLKIYGDLSDTPLQISEDCEQLKILEHGYKIKSYETVEYNEISLNTVEDYEFLTEKYS